MSVVGFIFKYLRKTKRLALIIFFSVIAHNVAIRGQMYVMAQMIGFLPE